MFRRPLFHIRLLPHFVFYLRVYFNCLFLVGTYQFMGDYNIYTLHPSLYITATSPLLPPFLTKQLDIKLSFPIPVSFVFYKYFPSLYLVLLYFFCLPFIFAPDDKYQWLSLVEAVLIPWDSSQGMNRGEITPSSHPHIATPSRHSWSPPDRYIAFIFFYLPAFIFPVHLPISSLVSVHVCSLSDYTKRNIRKVMQWKQDWSRRYV